jgi:hypothetical protein
MSTDRPRGITLRLLDFSAFTAEITAAQTEYDTLKIDYQYAVGTDSQGRTYAICTEGVGSEITDEDGLIVDWHGSRKTETGWSGSLFPTARYSFDLAEVTERETGETVDLADFVRVFGGRLEDNFRLWFHTLSA